MAFTSTLSELCSTFQKGFQISGQNQYVSPVVAIEEDISMIPVQNSLCNMSHQRPEDDTDDTVGCIVFDCFYRVLLVRGGAPQFKISFPKGSRKIHETKLQGAIREVKEETGLDISSFCINHDPIKFVRGRYFCIKLKWSFESYTLKPAADESGSVFWVYPEQLESMNDSSMNRDVAYFKENMYYDKNLIARHRSITKHMKQKLSS
jgi:8-oxo-dGTP pyrophosphatase MutT (NUDIX family)